MLWTRGGLIVLVVTLAGCASSPSQKAVSDPTTQPQESVLSDEQLRKDDAAHLPTNNVTGLAEPLGDLLRDLSRLDPKDPEFHWFQWLSPRAQDQVVEELNRYALVLRDKLIVKSRLEDNYRMRWRFAGPAPTELSITTPSQPSSKSRSVQITPLNLKTTKMPRDANDQRSLNAHIVWQVNPDTIWANGEKFPETSVTFTLPIHYSADCELANHVPKRVNVLGGMYAVALLPDGSARLTLAPDEPDREHDPLVVRMALNGKGEFKSVDAKPGDEIAVYLPDALGAGAGGFTYLGTHDGYLRFESYSWFYEIGPATRDLLEVLPYSKPPAEQAAATQAK